MRALLSVADREGIAALARELHALGVEMYATDGTREYLAGEGIEVRSVNELTDGGPTMGGQVKTFHHAVYAGILARRDVPEQMADLKAQGLAMSSLVKFDDDTDADDNPGEASFSGVSPGFLVTAGVEVRRIQALSYAWPAGALLVEHSDGIATSWDLTKYPGLRTRDAAVIAGVLYRDHRRVRDDATVLVMRAGRRGV